MQPRKIMVYKVKGSDGSILFWHFTEYDRRHWIWDCFDYDMKFVESLKITKERVTELIKDSIANYNYTGELIEDYYLNEGMLL
jgi:hypothetical protein